MAKAKAETSLWGEMLNVRLFKPNQGRVVRQVTAGAVAGIFILIGWRMHVTVLADVDPTLRYSISGAVVALGVWLAFRLVNWPTFANFLISVEAEMDKVSWASWDYLKRATGVVIVTMIVLGAYLFLWDIIWQQLFDFIGFLDLAARDA